MAEFKLYTETMYISPYVYSSLVALRAKEAAFDVEEVSLVDDAHRSPEYSRASVTGRIPSLEHRGFRLAESSAIAEYLEEVLPAPGHARLLPGGIQDRARARQLMAWMRSDLAALRDERSTVTMFYKFKLAPLSRSAQKDVDRLVRVADQLVPSGGGPLFGTWCLADAELAFMLHRLLLNEDSVPERLASYARAQWKHPAAREFVDHARPATVPEGYWTFSGTPRPERA
jgi:glutathione S-transferase